MQATQLRVLQELQVLLKIPIQMSSQEMHAALAGGSNLADTTDRVVADQSLVLGIQSRALTDILEQPGARRCADETHAMELLNEWPMPSLREIENALSMKAGQLAAARPLLTAGGKSIRASGKFSMQHPQSARCCFGSCVFEHA